MAESNTGGCLCGKIRYSISQSVHNIVACHCTHCQKASGSGMSHNAIVPASRFTLYFRPPKG